MEMPEFDVEAVFDAADYHYFYDSTLSPERTARDVDILWRLLDLRPGLRVLDLACGYGRIANRLAGRGCQVVGLDTSSAFLEEARRDAHALGIQVEYVQGDMRALPWDNQFDIVINWYTAFGYFDDTGNRAVLDSVYRVLVPGGRFIVDVPNRDRVLRTYQRAAVVERDGNYLIDRLRYDVETGRNYATRTIMRGGHIRRMDFFVRMFTYPELITWLRQAGFSATAGYDQDGDALTLDSQRMLVIAAR